VAEVLSQVILDNVSAAEQISKDALHHRGRTVFQGYLLDKGQF